MDENNNNNNEAPAQEQPEEKKDFMDGFKDALTDYVGSVGMQVDAVWQRSNVLWDNNHKLLAIANTVVCTPIVSHIAPVTGLFGIDVYHQLAEDVKKINDERARESAERRVAAAKLIGGIIVGATVIGIGTKVLRANRCSCPATC